MEASITFIHTPTLSERARGETTYPSALDHIAKARKALFDMSIVAIEHQRNPFDGRVLLAYTLNAVDQLHEQFDALESYLDPKAA